MFSFSLASYDVLEHACGCTVLHGEVVPVIGSNSMPAALTERGVTAADLRLAHVWIGRL